MGYRCDPRDKISRPNAFDVLGRAPSDVSVTVNEQPVTRQGEFWRREVGDLPNALAAVWQPVQVDAVDPGAGPNGANVPARRSGHRFVPMASETPFYDFDVIGVRRRHRGQATILDITPFSPPPPTPPPGSTIPPPASSSLTEV